MLTKLNAFYCHNKGWMNICSWHPSSTPQLSTADMLSGLPKKTCALSKHRWKWSESFCPRWRTIKVEFTVNKADTENSLTESWCICFETQRKSRSTHPCRTSTFCFNDHVDLRGRWCWVIRRPARSCLTLVFQFPFLLVICYRLNRRISNTEHWVRYCKSRKWTRTLSFSQQVSGFLNFKFCLKDVSVRCKSRYTSKTDLTPPKLPRSLLFPFLITETDRAEAPQRMTKQQILTLISIASVNFSSTICYSILGPFFPNEVSSRKTPPPTSVILICQVPPIVHEFLHLVTHLL